VYYRSAGFLMFIKLSCLAAPLEAAGLSPAAWRLKNRLPEIAFKVILCACFPARTDRETAARKKQTWTQRKRFPSFSGCFAARVGVRGYSCRMRTQEIVLKREKDKRCSGRRSTASAGLRHLPGKAENKSLCYETGKALIPSYKNNLPQRRGMLRNLRAPHAQNREDCTAMRNQAYNIF
jgi:hypothetical protein